MTRSYLKLPAYGRVLLDQRELGHHPRLINVWYGDRWWDRPKDAPCLCVGLDYTHGVFDWGVVAGVPVHVLWRGGRRVWRLAAELAEYAPSVVVYTGRGPVTVETLLAPRFGRRRRHPLWSIAAENNFKERQAHYYAAMLEQLQQEAAHG